MNAIQELACPKIPHESTHFVNKHSWRGKYKRILVITKAGLQTLNNSPWEVTNTWSWLTDVIEAYAEKKSASEFVLSFRDGKKSNNVTFSSDQRADVLTDFHVAQNMIFQNGEKGPTKDFPAFKIKRGEVKKDVIIRVRDYGIEELDSVSKVVRASYFYKDVHGVSTVSDLSNAFSFSSPKGCPHVYQSNQQSEIIKLVQATAQHRVGVAIENIAPVTQVQCRDARLKFHGGDEDDESISVVEFNLNKVTPRHETAAPRIFCLTERRVIERDPSTYSIVTTRPLKNIHCIVRHMDDAQRFTIQYADGSKRVYVSTLRDAVVSSILDAARGVENTCCFVTPFQYERGYSIAPLWVPSDAERELMYLKLISSPDISGLAINDLGKLACAFNSNVPYTSACYTDKYQKNVHAAINNLLPREMELAEELNPIVVINVLQALRRLFSTRTGFEAVSQVPGLSNRIIGTLTASMRILNEHINYAATEVIAALIQPTFEATEASDSTHEQLNKRLIFSNEEAYEALIKFIEYHGLTKTGALVVNGAIDIFVYLLCQPYSDSTDSSMFDNILLEVAKLERILFKLFHHPCLTVTKGVGMLMSAIINESTFEIAQKIQYASLLEGALIRHLHAAIFTIPKGEPRQIMQRNLSRELVRLWTASNDRCMATMKRIFPPGLLLYLTSDQTPPVDEEEQAALNARRKRSKTVSDGFSLNPFTSWHMRKVTKRRAAMPKATVRVRKQQTEMKFENWEMVFYNIKTDHCRHDLIWNHYTREELRETLDAEIRSFMQDQDMAGDEILSWNHTEFEVIYTSLSREPKVGDYYLRLLLEGEKGKSFQLQDPIQFFNELYQRFFHETDVHAKALCLQCLATVYRSNHETIGRFREIQYVIQMLGEVRDLLIRDRLLQFISSLILNVDNAKSFVDCRGVPLLINLLTLVHLETQKTVTPLQGNYIMAGDGQVRESEKEWYYCAHGSDREGPLDLVQVNQLWKDGTIHAKTLMWAIGMDDWAPLENIPQLRWTLVATGQSVFTYTQLGVLCLDMVLQITSLYPSRDVDGSIIRPMPRAKRQLCEPNCFPHIIQVLLTYDPELVDRVSRLLVELIRDNISVLPKIYLTGIFYFCLLYPGSNVLPISRLLKLTHNKQNYIAGDTGHGSLVARSFLKTILPEAMVCFLTNYEPEKFSEIYLGEFDTPEAIWNHEMRRRMMEKIAIHIGNFPIRLQTNTRSLFQFVPMAPIHYPELENELFCNMYYLRHLCNTQKFPNWPIVNQVELLQSILVEWKSEMEKKGAPISKEEAYETLGLKPSEIKSEDTIRKAYYKLASKYHPDKNPDGREIFEKIQKSYEILSSNTNTEGPDPDRLVLLMKAQIIIYSRYPQAVQPFRYAGYPMLLSSITRENTNEQLFSQKVSLLPYAAELCYYTVSVSPLNAEEVRREGGIEVISASLQRCVEVLTVNVTIDSMPAQVCMHTLKAFSVFGNFPACREVILQNRSICHNAVRSLNFIQAPLLVDAGIACASSFSVDSKLQDQLTQSGLLWHVISACFKYDYTLEDAGVEVTAENNVQHLRNNIAKDAIRVLGKMGGYLSGADATPKNELVCHTLNALLTPFMVNKLGDQSPLELLKLLNTNNENPFSIWHNETRGELLDYIDKQITGLYRSNTHDPNGAPNFVFKVLKDELVIGGIYVRVYNLQPKTQLPAPSDTLREFLGFLSKKSAGVDFRSKAARDPDYWKMLLSVRMTLEAIRNLLTNHFGAEVEFSKAGNIKLVCSFLDVTGDDEVPLRTLEVVNILTASTACINGLIEAECMAQLLPLLVRIPASRESVMNIMHKLIANSKLVNEISQHGGILYLLDIYFSATEFAIRSLAASVIAKVAIDKVYGPKLTIMMAKLFPPAFLAAMREDSNSSVHMFDNNHETPELIWNDRSRRQAQSSMSRMAQEFYARKEANRSEVWSLPEKFSVIYEEAENEISIAGVFLRLFLKQPTWAIRNPRQFLNELLDKFLAQVVHMQINENLELIAQSTVALLRAQPAVGDAVASTGHLPKLFPLLEHADRNVRINTSLILLALCESQACIDILATFEWMRHVMSGIRSTPESAVALVEILSKAFSKFKSEKGSLVPQATTTKLPDFLMNLIEKEANVMPNAAQIKALSINTLKSMTYDRTHGESMTRYLDAFPGWASYRDQRHDLFLTSGGAVGLLTGPTTGQTLLLTGSSAPTAPPPRNPTAPPPVAERK